MEKYPARKGLIAGVNFLLESLWLGIALFALTHLTYPCVTSNTLIAPIDFSAPGELMPW